MAGVVTILFTDLVGSTQLTEKLGEDGADRVRRAHFATLRAEIDRHRGDEVKNLGDGVMAVFQSAADALAAAVAMQQAVQRAAREGVPLSMRVGVHVGEVDVIDGDYFGTPVNIASRLCAAADGGQIVASEIARAIVGSRGGFSFRSLGALTLKGIEEPVAACEVGWEPAEEAVPLPAAVAQGPPGALVGRDDERRALGEALAAARGEDVVLVLLTGEPGIGKTTLALDLARGAHAEGCVVLYGRCEEEPLTPYQPFVEALRHYARHREADARACGEVLARLVPELGVDAMTARDDPETERLRLFDAVRALFARASKEAPVVLVLDDIHWADRPTLVLLRHLLRGDEPARLLVVGTYRDVELDRTHPLAEILSDLRREGGRRVMLRGLAEREVVALLERRAGHELDRAGRAFARALHAETEGNPFFIGEIVRHLVETGAIYLRDGRWGSDTSIDAVGLPESVREVVGRRLSRLSDACGDVLAIASVVGRDFELPLLARLTDRSEDELADLLEEAVAARVVEEAPGALDRYTFAHALVRETLYEELSTNRRVRLHRRIGEALETLYAATLDEHLGELAHHFFEASVGGQVAKAVEYARRAGERATTQLAFEEAVAHYERALQALEDADDEDELVRCDLLLALGSASSATGDLRRTRLVCAKAAEIARRHGRAERLARAALTYGGLWVDVGIVNEELVGLLRDAIAALPDDHALLPMLYGRLAMEMFAGDPAELDRSSARAVEVARALGDARVLAYTLVARRHALSGPSQLDERLAITSEAIDLASAVGDAALELRARAFRLIEHTERGAIEDVDRELQAFLALAEETRQPMYHYVSDLFRTGLAVAEGRLDEAEAMAPRLAEWAARQGRVTAIIATATQRFQMHLLRGTLDRIDRASVEVILAFSSYSPAYQLIGAWALLWLGDEEEARSRWEASLAHGFDDMPDNWATLSLLACAADLCRRFGGPADARAITTLLTPYTDRIVVQAATAPVMMIGTVRDSLGSLALVTEDIDDAVEHLERSLVSHARMRSRPLAVRTRVDLARALLARGAAGDHETARAHLAAALADADAMRLAHPPVAEARSLLHDPTG